MLTNTIRCCLMIVCVMLLISCTTQQPEYAQPKLADLATPAPGVQVSDEQAGEQSLTVLYVYRLILPLESDLTESLAILNTSTLPAGTVKNYQANGIRVGVIDMQGYLHLKNNLPVPPQDPRTPDEPPKAILDARVYRLTGTNQLIPLSVTPYINNSFRFEYTSPKNKTRSITMSKGRSRFLTKVTELSAGQDQLEITPQHHLLKNTLMPRKPEQTILDGRVFNDLTLRTALDKNRLLVLACDLPRMQEPAPEDSQDDESSTDTQNDDDEADEKQADDAPAQIPEPQFTIPDNLGTHWLLANRQGRTVQMILIFQIQRH